MKNVYTFFENKKTENVTKHFRFLKDENRNKKQKCYQTDL